MGLSQTYQIILIAVPAVAIIVGGWILGAVPNKSFISKVLTVIAEENLGELMKKNGFPRINMALFQAARIGFTLLIGLLITFIFGAKGTSAIFSVLIIFTVCYKFFYILLVYKDRARIKRLNIVLPYTIKSIAYLASVYPVNNALIKAIPLVPKEFRGDLENLCEDIDKDPTSFAPYQAFIDRYDGRLNRLDYYLKTLYRMSSSATKEEAKLLSNLNETISDEMSNARAAKNQSVNSTVAYLGLIPVALLTVMMLFLMIVISTAI